MTRQTPGKMYLADQRGLFESSQFRRHSTFSFGAYQHEHKAPFGRLYGLNEETLAGGHQLEFLVSHDSYLVLLPIVGAVAYSTGGGAHGCIDVEELTTLAVVAGTTLRLQNTFESEQVTFLHLWVQAATPLGLPVPAIGLRVKFDQQVLDNRLCELAGTGSEDPGKRPIFTPPLPFALSLGRFGGRHETVYAVQREGSQLFAYVLAGAFELEGRLLHEKDGLALWNTSEVELEALSNNALLLVLELLP